MTNQEIPGTEQKESWFRSYGPTLILLLLFLLFGLCCFIIGLLVGGGAGSGNSPETTAQTVERMANPSDSAVSTELRQTTAAPTQSTEAPSTEPATESTAAPTTEAPTEPTAPYDQDAIDDATTWTVYLTFDDGPGKYTFDVLDILDQYNVKATFFTVGYYVDRYPENAKAIVDRGHLIACHSYTHDMEKCYASVDAFMDEVAQWKQAVRNATGTLPDRICVRFPGRSTTPYAKDVADGIKARIAAMGARWFDWNAANNDKYPRGNVKNLPQKDYFIASYKECMGWYANDDTATVIFLTHETEKTTVETLAYMLQDLKEKGYTFKTLDHHPDWN